MQLDYLYGINPVKEGLRGRRRPVELFVDEQAGGRRIDEILTLAKACGVPVRQRRRQDLDRLAGLPHHQGVVLSIEPFPFADFDDQLSRWQESGQSALFLLLDGITDPHNLGAILRNADAAGCHTVVITKDRSCGITNVVDRASAGAVEHLAVCQVTNLARTLRLIARHGPDAFYRGEIAELIDAEMCILLSDIKGLYTSDPRQDPRPRGAPGRRAAGGNQESAPEPGCA